MKMHKRISTLAAALGLALVFTTGCSGQDTNRIAQSEGDSASSYSTEEKPPSASASTAEKIPFEIQNNLDDWTISGLTDPAPAEQLCQYFLDHFTPDDYVIIDCWSTYDPEIDERDYFVYVYTEDIEPFRNLLDSYDGPRTMIIYDIAAYSLSDLVKAETDVKSFLEDHPEIIYDDVERTDTDVVVYNVKEGYAELSQFADDYPIPKLLFVVKYIPEEMLNPD